jgi:hypothetical protein
VDYVSALATSALSQLRERHQIHASYRQDGQTRRFSNNLGQFESLTHTETDLLDRLITLLQAQSSSGEKLEDYLAAYSRSSAETHSPIVSISPITGGEKDPNNEYSSHLSATGAKDAHSSQTGCSRLSTLLPTNAPESTPKSTANAKVSFTIPQAVSTDLIEAFFQNIQPWLPMLHCPKISCSLCRPLEKLL